MKASRPQDEYIEPVVYEYPGIVVRVHRPILTDSERAKRMKQLHDAAAALLKSGRK